MKLVIAGSRTVHPSIEEIDAGTALLGVGSIFFVDEVICGGANGADACGAEWAIIRSIAIHYEPITKEDIATHGKYLGPRMRNRRMAERGDVALVFWDGKSAGSADMVTRMVARKKPVVVIPTSPKRSRSPSRTS